MRGDGAVVGTSLRLNILLRGLYIAQGRVFRPGSSLAAFNFVGKKFLAFAHPISVKFHKPG